jgi:hypothetical protein
MREAAFTKWRDSRCSSLVLLKPLVVYVFGASLPAVTMGELEKMRDDVLEVVKWAFGVVLGDDGEWPEPRAQDAAKSDALEAAKRLAWFEAILRISFAARRGKERDVGHMLQKPAEPEADGAESEAVPAGVSPEHQVAWHRGGVHAAGALQAEYHPGTRRPSFGVAAGEGTEYSEFDCEVYATHAQCSERRTRAQVAVHDIEARNDQSDGAVASGGRASARDDGHRNYSGTEASGGTVSA